MSFRYHTIEASDTYNGQPGLKSTFSKLLLRTYMVDPLGNNLELVGFYIFFPFPPLAEDITAL
jgi:hypothetical protein